MFCVVVLTILLYSFLVTSVSPAKTPRVVLQGNEEKRGRNIVQYIECCMLICRTCMM